MTIEQDEGRGLFGRTDAEGAQMRQVGEVSGTAGFENVVGGFGAEAGDTHELFTAGVHDFDGGVAEIEVCPRAFRIDIKAQVPRLFKGKVFDIPTIITE